MTWSADVLTLYPEMFPGPLGKSLSGKDLKKGINTLIKDLEMRTRIEKQGRLLIEDHFNVINMKNNLKTIFEEN